MFKNNFVKNFPAAGLSLRLSLRFFQINATCNYSAKGHGGVSSLK